MRELTRILGCGLTGLIAFFEPTFNFILICTLCVLLDCLTAFLLSRRVKKSFPEKAKKAKFESHYAAKIFKTILEIYTLIITAFLIEQYILTFCDLHLPNIVAGVFCFIQLWSILENHSSCNGAKWAKTLQKIMVDKTERHFDIDLCDFKDKKEKK